MAPKRAVAQRLGRPVRRVPELVHGEHDACAGGRPDRVGAGGDARDRLGRDAGQAGDVADRGARAAARSRRGGHGEMVVGNQDGDVTNRGNDPEQTVIKASPNDPGPAAMVTSPNRQEGRATPLLLVVDVRRDPRGADHEPPDPQHGARPPHSTVDLSRSTVATSRGASGSRRLGESRRRSTGRPTARRDHPMKKTRTLGALGAVLSLSLALAACSGGDGGSGGTQTTARAVAPTTTP